MRDVDTKEYLINGGFVVSMFQKSLQYGDTILDYTGSDVEVERLNSSKPLRKDLVVEVLTVGNLYPPNLTYTYLVSKGVQHFHRWRAQDRWSHCDKLCGGRQQSRPVCVRVEGGDQVDTNVSHCALLSRPETRTKRCNIHCSLAWEEAGRGRCDTTCAPGKQSVQYKCVKKLGGRKGVVVREKYCRQELPSPRAEVECEGPCEGLQWSLGSWSTCSVSCGGGSQARQARCEDSEGHRLEDARCGHILRTVERVCGQGACPEWEVGEWSGCSTTCGEGLRERALWCRVGDSVTSTVVAASQCGGEAPAHREGCSGGECVVWRMGRWGLCSVR